MCWILFIGQNLQAKLNIVFTNNQLMEMSVCVFDEMDANTCSYDLLTLSQNLHVRSTAEHRITCVSRSVLTLALLNLFDRGLFCLAALLLFIWGFMGSY
jgi:galactitol-specific phosphotransferase system IIB component